MGEAVALLGSVERHLEPMAMNKLEDDEQQDNGRACDQADGPDRSSLHPLPNTLGPAQSAGLDWFTLQVTA